RRQLNNIRQDLARPSSPALADWLGVLFDVHFLQPFNAVSHYIFRFFPGRFEQRPEKRQRKKAPVEFPPRRLQNDFLFAVAGRGVTDGEPNGDSEAERAENSRHWIFPHEIFGTLKCPARFFFGLVPRLAHLRGNFLCCMTKLLTPSSADVLWVWLKLLRWKRFVPRKVVFVRILTKLSLICSRPYVSLHPFPFPN